MGIFDPVFKKRPRPPSYQTLISRKIGKGIAALIIAGAAGFFGFKNKDTDSTKGLTVAQKKNVAIETVKTDTNYEVLNAIKTSKPLTYAVIKNALVVKVLRNDNKGARHQRWIVQIENGVTITIIHNIDIAEKVPLAVGDSVEVAGELIYGDRKKDPILHWTHEDPKGKRIAGYVVHNGERYGHATGP